CLRDDAAGDRDRPVRRTTRRIAGRRGGAVWRRSSGTGAESEEGDRRQEQRREVRLVRLVRWVRWVRSNHSAILGMLAMTPRWSWRRGPGRTSHRKFLRLPLWITVLAAESVGGWS